jgi:hypothetical protein
MQIRKKGEEIKKNLLLWNYWANLNQSLLRWSLGGPLSIEQFWPFEEISIFSHGGHLGYRTTLTDTTLKGDHPRIISAKFGWDWLSIFREDFFILLSQSQPNVAEMILGWFPFKIVSGSAVLYPRWPPWLKIEISSNGQNCSILSQNVLSSKFCSYWANGFRKEDFYGNFP